MMLWQKREIDSMSAEISGLVRGALSALKKHDLHTAALIFRRLADKLDRKRKEFGS